MGLVFMKLAETISITFWEKMSKQGAIPEIISTHPRQQNEDISDFIENELDNYVINLN